MEMVGKRTQRSTPGERREYSHTTSAPGTIAIICVFQLVSLQAFSIVSKNVSGNRGHHFWQELSLTAVRAALALPGDSPAMAAPNQVTGYDPESLRIVSMDTVQTEAPMPTEEEYLQDMLRVWRGKKNSAVASRDAGALAAKQHAASRSQHAQGKSAPSVASQRAKQLQWRPKNTPRIEKDDIIVVLKPRETLDIKAAFGPGQAGAAVRSILGADASVGLAVWPIWEQNVLVCTLKSVDAAEKLLRDITLPVGGRQLPFRGHPKLSGEFCRGVVHVSQDETSETVKSKLSAEPNVVTVRKLGDTPVAVITFAGTKVPRTVLYNCERLPVHLYKKTWATEQILVRDRSLDAAQAAGSRYLLLLLMAQQNTNASRAASSVAVATRLELPVVLDAEDSGGAQQAPIPKTSPKKAPATKPNKPEPKKAHTGPSTNVKSGTPWKPPVLMVKDFPPLTPVQAQVSCWGGAVSGPSPSPSPTETALQQQIEELRRQNRFLARKIQELEAKQVGSSEPEQGTEIEDGDDGSSVTSDLTSVSRRDGDTVVGSVSATGANGRLETLERKTEQFEERVAALPNQIMSAVRASFQDMSRQLLKAVQPWVSTQIKNTTQCEPPQLKRKTASRQAVEEDLSGLAPGGPVRPLMAATPAPGPGRSPAP
ncbi:hypothetical protein HPB52_018278 [Rhipicephalus sanguineus]|uniref:Uncharacterized protein n=1 Tax=Rhipicephalus sanguineus TaxID=34632 RepID=A0A9D4QAL6_RHISA|nr:hypothetical protein HPB52_018278 [Rhipicephalus sanguineus]